MKKLLEKLKLVQYFNSELTISKDEFLEMIKEKVDQETPGFFSDSLDAWTSHKNKFKGVITHDIIVFKRRQSFFEIISSIPEATITFSKNECRPVVFTKINGIKGPFLALSIVAIIVIPVFLFFGIRSVLIPDSSNHLILSLFATFTLIFLPCFYMRFGISQLKKKISKDLYNLEKK